MTSTKMRQVPILLAGGTSNGARIIRYFTVRVNEKQRQNGFHRYLAKKQARRDGIKPPYTIVNLNSIRTP
jgi:hypothetical protein